MVVATLEERVETAGAKARAEPKMQAEMMARILETTRNEKPSD
jgi:hypothetical protein